MPVRSTPRHCAKTRSRAAFLAGARGALCLLGKGNTDKSRLTGLRLCPWRAMLIEYQDPMRLQVVIAREGVAGEKIVHGLIELDTQRGTLMVEEEKDTAVVALPHAHLHCIRHFE